MNFENYCQKIKFNIKIEVNKAGKLNFCRFRNNFTCTLDFCLPVFANTWGKYILNAYFFIFGRLELANFPVLAKAYEYFVQGSLSAFYYKFDTNKQV